MTESDNLFWKRNLFICMIGAFATTVGLTIMLPFLPLYVNQLGIVEQDKIIRWSGIAFSVTFLSAGLVAPIWGRLGDRFGRKTMLIRASLGLSIILSLIGFATNVYNLVLMLFLVGLAGGYGSGSTILIAVQAPQERSGWALGMVASGVMAGNLAGPLLGGILAPLIGIRETFWSAGGFIFIAFLLTLFGIKEEHKPKTKTERKSKGIIGKQDKPVILVMLISSMFLMIANLSIEPIITIFISSIESNVDNITFMSGLVLAASALGSVLSASVLGKIADKIGHVEVIIGGMFIAGLLIIPQAFVTSGWELVLLRFLMGIALGGLLPCTSVIIRQKVAVENVGSVLGYSVSAKFIGQFIGPFLGGMIGSHLGIRYVFILTTVVMFAGAILNLIFVKKTFKDVYESHE